ncbi:hypothetical protein EVAR_19582_1 [Eumeta japonica]|uniref:Uncharacterized protein n=1 Tax=Eumeta variegata TaxID=151549 RepID=A0A4C1UGJ3_EUMVA|nr:hypothetical protein EVAR_19582_1 [Eumeta japonica]
MSLRLHRQLNVELSTTSRAPPPVDVSQCPAAAAADADPLLVLSRPRPFFRFHLDAIFVLPLRSLPFFPVRHRAGAGRSKRIFDWREIGPVTTCNDRVNTFLFQLQSFFGRAGRCSIFLLVMANTKSWNYEKDRTVNGVTVWTEPYTVNNIVSHIALTHGAGVGRLTQQSARALGAARV